MAACLPACLPQRDHTTTATLLPLTSNCFKPLCSLILILLLLLLLLQRRSDLQIKTQIENRMRDEALKP
jgi:hypothetical protein